MADQTEDEQVVRIGPYLVQDVVGSGPHGTVYAVLHEEKRHRLTLKRLHEPARKGLGRTFNRIASVVVALSHPAIADVGHIVMHGDHVAIIGDLVDGRPLSQVLAEDGPLTPLDTVGLAKQICAGLMYAHQRCVYHTSLRPENVFLLPDGGVRITDFAIAALYGQSVRRRPHYTAHHEVYFAPEFRESGVIHALSDVYSLGVLLYAMLLGGLPVARRSARGGRFSYLEIGDQAAVDIDDLVLSADALPEATPPTLRGLIAASMAPEVSRRPGSVNEFADALREVRSPLVRSRPEAREQRREGRTLPRAPGPRVRVCSACGRPVSPAGRVCLACGLVLREATEESGAVDYFHRHARRLLAKHDLGGAEKAYRRALERHPREAALHNELGDVLAVGNRFDEAVEEYRQAVRLDARDDDAWHDLGVSLAALNRRGEAREALERAAKLTNRDEVRLSAMLHLGTIAADEGRLREAAQVWEDVLQEDPGLIPVRMALASSYASLSQYERAEEHLRAVLSIEPGRREAQNLLARVQERAQLEREDVDTGFGLIDDMRGGTTYIGPGFNWTRL